MQTITSTPTTAFHKWEKVITNPPPFPSLKGQWHIPGWCNNNNNLVPCTNFRELTGQAGAPAQKPAWQANGPTGSPRRKGRRQLAGPRQTFSERSVSIAFRNRHIAPHPTNFKSSGTRGEPVGNMKSQGTRVPEAPRR